MPSRLSKRARKRTSVDAVGGLENSFHLNLLVTCLVHLGLLRPGSYFKRFTSVEGHASRL